MPISTSASLGSEWALDGGCVLIGTRGSSVAMGEMCVEGGGQDKQSASGSGEGAFSMHSESGVVDMVVVWMMIGVCVVVFRIALGCLL